MTYHEFMTRFERGAVAMAGLSDPFLPAEEVGDPDKNIHLVKVDRDVSLLVQRAESDVVAVSVMAEMSQLGSARGVLAYALAVEALALGDEAWRKGILERMHLTDGKYRGGSTRTQARGWIFEMTPRSPARNLMTLTAAKI